MKYRIIVYDWNPNGTNDIAIESSTSESDLRCIDTLQEACFGIDITKFKPYFDFMDYRTVGSYVSLKKVLKHIAVSPMEDGSTTLKFLSKYFKSIKV